MSKRWWDDPDHKQKYWGEADWRDWEKHGRPAIPREARLGSDAPLPLSTGCPLCSQLIRSVASRSIRRRARPAMPDAVASTSCSTASGCSRHAVPVEATRCQGTVPRCVANPYGYVVFSVCGSEMTRRQIDLSPG